MYLQNIKWWLKAICQYSMSVAIFVISESEVKVYLTTRYKVWKGLKILKLGLCIFSLLITCRCRMCMVLAYFELNISYIKDTGDSLDSSHLVTYTSPCHPHLYQTCYKYPHILPALWKIMNCMTARIVCVSMISVSGSITSIIVWGSPQKLINTDPWYFPVLSAD